MPRVGIGNHFAIMEAQVVLAILSIRFRVELAPSGHIEPEPLITSRPRTRSRGDARSS
jgi:cytochrome P450